MTYQITVTNSVYVRWKSRTEYFRDEAAPSMSYHRYLKHHFGDCIIDAAYINYDLSMTFKSEAHYTWFLLQQ